MKVLNLNTSILGENSVSTKYSKEVINEIKRKNNNVEVIVRDLADDSVTPLTGKNIAFRNDENHEVTKQHNKLIDELKSVDVLVISAPVYNFQVPHTLIHYFDAVAQAGKTFNYTENGQVGYVKAKAIVVISSGGYYVKNGDSYREDYLKAMLGFLGIKDIQFIHLEGLAAGATPEQISQQFNEQLIKIEV